MQVGDIVDGRYRLLDLLGEGAAGKVFRCEDLGRNNIFVALKLLHAKDVRWETFFRREFEVLSRLQHPNLVSVYDFGPAPEENTWYFTQELVVGRPLLEAAAGKKIDDAISLFIEVCRALEFIHGHGVLHRDLKPANILVQHHAQPGERVRVLDFGLWRELDNTPQRGARWAGTPPYLASEVLRGFGHSISADLYAVGITLFQVLTRKLPHGRGTPQELLQARKDPPPDLAGMVKPELARLIARLLDEEPSGRPQSAAEVASLLSQLIPNHAVAMPPALGRARLVGRDAERARVSDAVEAVKAQRPGAPRLVMVSGAAGLGKSRFVQELKAEVQLKGGRSAIGVCAEDLRWPYRPVAELVRSLAPLAGRAQLTESERNVLARLLPEVGGARAQPSVDFGRAERDQFHTAVIELLLSLAGPTASALIIEDIQHADAASLALLEALLKRTRGTPVLLVVTALEPQAVPRELVEVAGLEVLRVKLEPLTPSDVRTLACALLGVTSVPDGFVDMLAAHSRGSPLMVEELLALMIERGDLKRGELGWNLEDLQRVGSNAPLVGPIVERLQRLSDIERDALSALAVLDRPSGPKLLAAVAKLDIATVKQALASAESGGLVRVVAEVDGRPRAIFRHPHVRDALQARLKERGELAAWHRVCAVVLEDKGKENLPAVAETLAHHLELGDEPARAVRMYLVAGERALQTLAFSDAVRLGKKAHRLLQRDRADAMQLAETDLLVGRALILAGHTAEARAFLEGAVSRSGVHKDHELFSRLHVALADAMGALGLTDAGLAHLERALAVTPAAAAPGAAARLLLARGALRRKGEPWESLEDAASAMGLWRGAPPQDDVLRVDELMSTAALSAGQTTQALEAARRCLARAQELRQVVEEIPARRRLAHVLACLGERLEARQNINVALDLALRSGHRVEEALLTKALGDQLFISGAYGEAITRYQRSATLAAELGQVVERADTIACIGRSYYARGDYERALEHLRAAAEAFERYGVLTGLITVRSDVAVTLLAKNMVPDAEAGLRSTAKMLPASGFDDARAALLHAQGQLFTARGDLQKARKAFLYAAVLCRRNHKLYALGEVLAGFGQLLLRARAPERASRMARRAESIFTRLDARGQLKRITPLLNAAAGLSGVPREAPASRLR